MQNKFQNHLPQKNLINQFQSENIKSEFSRDIAEERFQTPTFEPKSISCSKYQKTHNLPPIDPISVKNYSQQNPQNLDFDLPRTKQTFELSNTMTNFIQFYESSCRSANKSQTSNITSLPLHNGQESKNTVNKILPGSFTQFQPQSHVETVGIEPLNPFGVQQTICSKPLTDSIPSAPSISTFPPQLLPSAE